MNTRQIERIHALQRRSDATCEEWQAATEDLRSAAGRRIFYSNYDRGNIPSTASDLSEILARHFS